MKTDNSTFAPSLSRLTCVPIRGASGETRDPPTGGVEASAGPPKTVTVRIAGLEWQRNVKFSREEYKMGDTCLLSYYCTAFND